MSLFPDPPALLAIADRIADHAAAARARASELGTAVAAAHWHGPAADAFGWSVQAVLVGLRRAGSRLDDAADALRRHAALVRALLDEIERIAGHAVAVGGDVGQIAGDALLSPGDLAGDARALLGDSASLVGDVGHLLGFG